MRETDSAGQPKQAREMVDVEKKVAKGYGEYYYGNWLFGGLEEAMEIKNQIVGCDRRLRGQSPADGQAGRSCSERQQTRNQPLLLRVLCDWRWLPGTGVADDFGLNSVWRGV